MTAPDNQTVGQSLTLECIGITVRGITSRVEIVWRRGNVNNRPVRNTQKTATIVGNSLMYTDTYTISQLNTTDEGVVYQCRLVIRTSDPVKVNDIVRLNVTGEYFTEILFVNVITHDFVCYPCRR